MLALTSFRTDHDGLIAQLASARQCTPRLFRRALADLRAERAALSEREETRAIERHVEAGAWIDAALTLAKLSLPCWTVRRLLHDGGEWHCALSQHRDLPDWLDNAVETHHADLALAVLSALLEAGTAASPAAAPQSSEKQTGGSIALCCENFS